MLSLFLLSLKLLSSSCGIPNCAACDGIKCILCDKGYKLDDYGRCDDCDTDYAMLDSMCVYAKCADDSNGCLKCSTSSSCQTCQKGFEMSQTEAGDGICYYCKEGYELSTTTNEAGIKIRECHPPECEEGYENCKKCDTSNKYSCSECEVGYDFVTEDGNQRCLKCAEGYHKDETTHKCKLTCDDENCDKCEPADTCNECKWPYIKNDHNLCNKCRESWEEIIENGKVVCKAICPSHCTKCDQPTKCLECELPYKLITFAGVTDCSDCIDNYRYDYDTHTCIELKCNFAHCKICKSDTECKTCDKTYEIDENGGCDACTTGYEKDPNVEDFTCKKIDCSAIKQCIQCGSSSTICERCRSPYVVDSKGGCDACEDGYEKDPNSEEFTCKQIDCSAIKHCNKCGSSSTTCEECQSPYTVDENKQCNKCIEGYFQDKDAQEFTCITNGCNINNCLKCASTTECAQCKSPYAIDYSKGCESCIDGYESDSSASQFTCIMSNCKVEHCSVCSTETECEKCNVEYALDDKKKCTKCAEGYQQDDSTEEFKCVAVSCEELGHCTKCNSKYECLQCEDNYLLDEYSQCAKCAEGYTLYIDSLGELYCRTTPCEVENCKICNYVGNCYECETGFIESDDKKCIAGSNGPSLSLGGEKFDGEIKKGVQTLDLKDTSSSDTFYTVINRAISEVIINNPNDAKIELRIPVSNRDQNVKIQPENDQTKAQILCEYGASLSLANSASLTIVGKKNIHIQSLQSKLIKDDESQITIGTIIPTGKMEMTASQNSVHVKEMQIKSSNSVIFYGYGMAQIDKLVINDNCNFAIEQAEIKNAEIGVGSVFNVDGNNKYNYLIFFYSKQDAEKPKCPIQSNFVMAPQIDSWTVKRRDSSKAKISEDMEFIVTEIELGPDKIDLIDNAKYECSNYLEKFVETDSQFNARDCRTIERGESSVVQLYVHHEDKKGGGGGLPGGAIAGIVIGVIVVVGAIIGVVVFLIIRKKKNDNNSSDAENDAGANSI